jgi:hypothetical protein
MEIPLLELTTPFFKNFIIIISLSLLRICHDNRNPARLAVTRQICYRKIYIAGIDFCCRIFIAIR